MRKKKIVGIFIVILLIFSTTTFSIARIGKVEQQLENNFSITITPILPLTQQQNILIFGFSGDADKLDPGDITDGESIARTDNIFEGLVEYVPGTADIQPCLATSWNISSDGKIITFKLREGVKFHDGTDFNADAVVFSFERQYNTSHPYHQYGEWVYWTVLLNDVKKVEKIDNYMVNILLEKPNADILRNLAMWVAAIVSPANAEKWKEDAFKHPVGTGPFKFVEWVKDDHITLEAYQDYWRGKPKIDSLIFRVIQDSSDRLQALQTNTIQGMADPSQASFDTIKADKNLTLLVKTGMNLAYMAINNGYGYYDTNQNKVHDPDEPWVKTLGYFEPFTNKLVRQAINYAINKTAIIKDIYGGTAIVAKTGIPPSMLGYNNNIDYSYDPEKARELLTEAGYPNGFNTTLWVMPVSRLYIDDPLKVAEAFQGYLEDVNIRVDIYTTDWSTYLQKAAAGEHPMCFLGWISDNGDPNNFMNPLYGANQCIIGSASNVAFYNNTQVQDLLSAALQTYDEDERALLYKQAQEIIHEDAPFVYLAHVNQYLVFRSNVKGFIMNPTGRLFFYPVGFENKPDEPDGRVIFTASSTGPCGIAWGYGIGNESDHTPDAYIETGKGIIINFGTMPYHSLYSPSFTNYLVEDNDEEVLWKVSEKTLMNIDWQHAEVKHHIQVICTPQGETTGTFMTDQKAFLICSPPTYQPKDHKENCMVFTGTYKNGSKTESISGFAVLLAIREENSSSMFPEPWIMLWLFQIKDGGKYEPLLTALWAKNGYDTNGIIIPKAKTFHVNFWML